MNIKCKICTEDKDISHFRKNRYTCRKCENNQRKQRYYENRESELIRVKNYKERNEEKVQEYRRDYKRKNKIQNALQTRLCQGLHKTHFSATLKQYLNCTYEKLYSWIEFQFYDGMNWENYGTFWHIDHTIPVSRFNFQNEEDIKKCFNWINLRPLRKEKNLSKSNKVNMKDYLLQEIKSVYFNQNFRQDGVTTYLGASLTTSFEKSYEGTQVMTDPNGKINEDSGQSAAKLLSSL